jgi:hypothetical protein
MKNEEISNNNKTINIYKKVGSILGKSIYNVKSETNSYIPNHILKTRDDVETKLSMAMMSPNKNVLKITKYQRTLNGIDLMIENRILRGESL